MRRLLKRLLALANGLWNRWILRSNGVVVGKNLVINGRIYVKNQGTLVIGDGVTLNSGSRFNPVGGHHLTRLIVYPGATLTIREGAGISNSTIVAQSSVDIGEGTLIGGSCNIWDTDFHSLDPLVRGTSEDRGKSRPVRIGKKVFLGAHCIVLKGVAIGDRSIVRAGSVVSRDVDADSVFRGG